MFYEDSKTRMEERRERKNERMKWKLIDS